MLNLLMQPPEIQTVMRKKLSSLETETRIEIMKRVTRQIPWSANEKIPSTKRSSIN